MESKSIRVVSTLSEKFMGEYLSHLLASFQMNRGRGEGKSIEMRMQMVKFEADMALAHSARDFTWAQALAHSLRTANMPYEQKSSAWGTEDSQTLAPLVQTTKLKNQVGKQVMVNSIANICSFKRLRDKFSRRIGYSLKMNKYSRDTKRKRNHKSRLGRVNNGLRKERKMTRWSSTNEVANIDDRIQTLRSLIPGGNEMEAMLLFEESASYIQCLKMQVFMFGSTKEAAIEMNRSGNHDVTINSMLTRSPVE